MLKKSGYKLTGDLLNLAASGPNHKYVAEKDSDVAQKIASDSGFVKQVTKQYLSDCKGSTTISSGTHSYEFPVSQGDLGAALHGVEYSYTTAVDTKTAGHYLNVTITDTFDFTEFKNPFTQSSFKAGFLWLANDIAYIDTKWGLLDPVSVEIHVVTPIDP